MEHKEFTVQDLLGDASFKRFVKGIANADEIQFWNDWVEYNDENREIANDARSRIIGFEFKSPALPDLDQQWEKLHKKTSGKRQIKLIKGPHNSTGSEVKLTWMFRAVAIALIMVFAGFGAYYFYNADNSATHLQNLVQEKTISTNEGEHKTLTFSNGSRIVLNSSSKITYRFGVFEEETIDVTLEGEAWFDVESDGRGSQPAFAVRTPDGIIRDIGTEFLVSIQHNQSRVVIQEGIVEVDPVNLQLRESSDKQNSFRATQGEMVEFNREKIINRVQVNPTLFTSWATGYMELEETGLQEFANYVENRFGVQVVLNISSSENFKLNGTVYFRSLDELIRSVAEVTGLPAYRSSDTNRVFIGELHETNQ